MPGIAPPRRPFPGLFQNAGVILPPGPPLLGLDIGGVLVDRAFHDKEESFFGSAPLEAPPVVGALEEIVRLHETGCPYRIVLISKARPKIAQATRQWLEHLGFHERTGVARQSVHFVENRIDKAPLCERLGVTHFVDDRNVVLESLTSVQHRFLFTGGLGSITPDVPGPGIEVFHDWPALSAALLATLSA